MTLETDTANDLDREEGERLFVYDDATGMPIRPGSVVIGHPTVGFGRALDTKGISHNEAKTMEANDIRDIESGLDQDEPWWRQQPSWVQRAMLEIAFQMGVHGEGGFKMGLGCIKAGDYQGARTAFSDSKWANVQSPARAKREIALISDQAPDGIGGTS